MQHQKVQNLWQNNADILKAAAKYQFGSTAGNDQVFFPSDHYGGNGVTSEQNCAAESQNNTCADGFTSLNTCSC